MKDHFSTKEVEMISVEELKTHPSNPRQGDIGAIVESMRVHGFYGALIVQKETNYILAGNHRFKAAKSLGYSKVPVMFVEVSEEEAKRILLVDNKTSDLATYDEHELLSILAELNKTPLGLEGTGFDEDDLDDLAKSLSESFMDDESSVSAERETTLHITCPNCDHHFEHTFIQGKKRKSKDA